MTASYSVHIKRSAEKEIRDLPDSVRLRVVTAIRQLADNPRPHGCEKLTARDAWRIRLGTHRIVYTVEDSHLVIEVVRVAHRREVYR
ncbi:type II toxin-antitoxin system RelE/ParE family toxin [Myxococcota bacterium]|nr:type II toxin-antitoxin system RelE/ParE family toxin [Myxococcota bacterium]